jgi:hypothetical protein
MAAIEDGGPKRPGVIEFQVHNTQTRCSRSGHSTIHGTQAATVRVSNCAERKLETRNVNSGDRRRNQSISLHVRYCMLCDMRDSIYWFEEKGDTRPGKELIRLAEQRR